MKSLLFSITALLVLWSGQSLYAQQGLGANPDNLLPDRGDSPAARSVVDRVIAEHDINKLQIIIRASYPKLLEYCFGQITKMDKPFQAQILEQCLLDAQVFEPRFAVPMNFNSGQQVLIQSEVIAASYRLLGEPVPPWQGMWSDAEAAALGARVKRFKP